MPEPTSSRTLLDGHPPTAEALAALAAHNYGHYTAFIAIGGAVRGWSLHLRRLIDDAAAVLGVQLDVAALRTQLLAVLDGAGSTPQSVRITVFPATLDLRRPSAPAPAAVLVRAHDWIEPAARPLRVRTRIQLREAAQHKHIGLFPAVLARRQAQQAGADDALLLAADGQVAEGPTWNLGVYDGQRVLWPAAPALPGVTQQLLGQALRAAGVHTTTADLRVDDLYAARCVFACNARQPLIAVAELDGVALQRDPDVEARLLAAYAGIGWEPV